MSTVGIDCMTIALQSGELSVWDFGGQLEYTTTHSFFLSIEVLINQSREDKGEERTEKLWRRKEIEGKKHTNK